MYKRLLAVGDIHGCYDMFIDLWQKVAFHPNEDMAVFLGDYIDRGPDSAKMMEWVMAHQNQPNMVFLRGNHEAMMYDSFRRSASSLWHYNGGRTTLSSMHRENKFTKLLAPWLDAIQNMPLYQQISVNEQNYIFAHGNIYPEVPLDEHSPDNFYWDRTLAMSPQYYHGEDILVFGHTPVQTLNEGLLEEPFPWVRRYGHIILMDTGSYFPQGRISCMDVITGQVWQSRANKQKWSDMK